MAAEPTADAIWRRMLSGPSRWDKDRRRLILIPASQRCKNCCAPLKGIGAVFMRFIGRAPYERNPRFCSF